MALAGKTKSHHSLLKVVIPLVIIPSYLDSFYPLFISIPFSFSLVVAFLLKNAPCVTLLPSLQFNSHPLSQEITGDKC